MSSEPKTQDSGEAGQHLLSIDEAADLLRAPVATVRYWRHLGTGPHSFRLGRRVLYRYTDLVTWVNDLQDNDGPHAA
jgi:excisionase family DNA binding protein